jgi:hypothetical protein
VERPEHVDVESDERALADGQASRIGVRAVARPVAGLVRDADVQRRADDRVDSGGTEVLLNVEHLRGRVHRIGAKRQM